MVPTTSCILETSMTTMIDKYCGSHKNSCDKKQRRSGWNRVFWSERHTNFQHLLRQLSWIRPVIVAWRRSALQQNTITSWRHPVAIHFSSFFLHRRGGRVLSAMRQLPICSDLCWRFQVASKIVPERIRFSPLWYRCTFRIVLNNCENEWLHNVTWDL